MAKLCVCLCWCLVCMALCAVGIYLFYCQGPADFAAPFALLLSCHCVRRSFRRSCDCDHVVGRSLFVSSLGSRMRQSFNPAQDLHHVCTRCGAIRERRRKRAWRAGLHCTFRLRCFVSADISCTGAGACHAYGRQRGLTVFVQAGGWIRLQSLGFCTSRYILLLCFGFPLHVLDCHSLPPALVFATTSIFLLNLHRLYLCQGILPTGNQ